MAALAAALLVPTLAACGGDSGNADSSEASSESSSASSSESASQSPTAAAAGAGASGELDEVSFAGEVGESIDATWNAAIATPEETTVTTLVKGDGEAVADGDTVSVYLWVGSGTSQEQVFSDYDNGAPEAIPNDPSQLDGLFSSLFSGQTYGSRVAAVTSASAVFGDQENQLGVEPTDSLVIVADLISKQAVSPTPTDDKVSEADPTTQPKVVETDGKPTGLDFTGIEEPALDAPVQRVILTEGTGVPVKSSDTLKVNYLGSTYEADAPFDESYSRGEPLDSPLSGLIPGWSIGLTGVKVGSRVLIQVPPAYGYGEQGSGAAIPGNATLWFVIDVISAS